MTIQYTLWKPVVAPNTTIPPKPPKGTKTSSVYGRTVVRMTNHTADAGQSRMRNDYSRRQPYNCDNTRIFLYGDGGSWHLYDANTFQHLRQLSGPGGDAEMQWGAADPHTCYYMDNNGGTKIYALNVESNTHTVYYDLAPQLTALFGATADRAWTRSEGSPSKDGRLWGFIVQHYNQSTGNFDSKGLVVFDVVAHTVVWSKPIADNDRPDHVSMTPCGRWFSVAGGTNPTEHVIGVAPDNFNQVRTLNAVSEHSDFFLLPNGHSAIATIDYQSNNGDLFWIDLEDASVTRHIITHAYNNPWFPQDYSFHISGKAYNKPGWVVIGNYGAPCRNLFLYNTASNTCYGVAETYAVDNDYFDEVHACPNRDLTRIAFNDNYNHSTDVDCYQAVIPGLPNA